MIIRKLVGQLGKAAAIALILPLVGTVLLALVNPLFAIPIAAGGIFALAFAEAAGFVPSLATMMVFLLARDRFGRIVTFLATELAASISCIVWWTCAFGQSFSSFNGPSFLLFLAAISALATLVVTLPDLLWREQKDSDRKASQLNA